MKQFVRVKEFMAENKQGLGLPNTIWAMAIRIANYFALHCCKRSKPM